MKKERKDKILKAIKKIDFNNIEDEIERLRDELDIQPDEDNFFIQKFTEHVESLEKTCHKYKPKDNKSYVLANGILEAMCLNNHLNKFIDSNEFKEFSYYIDTTDEDKIDEILTTNKNTFKESLRLLKCLKLINNKQPKYALLTKNWFSKSDYEITDNKILKQLIPLVLGYMGKYNDVNIYDFIEKIEEIIKYIIKPAIEHNNIHFIEKQISEAIGELDEVEIKLKDKEINVFPVKIIYKTNYNGETKKILVYITKKSNTEEEILFDDIERITVLNTSSNFAVPSMNNQSFMFNPMYSNLSIDSYNKEFTNTKLLLELDTQIVEYYQIRPLKNQKLYLTEDEIKEFSNEYHYEAIKNRCYLSAEDNDENIISTILHTLDYVKVISPSSVNDKIASKFKNYLKKSNIDICSEDNNIEPDDDLKKYDDLIEDKPKPIKKKKSLLDNDDIEFDF